MVPRECFAKRLTGGRTMKNQGGLFGIFIGLLGTTHLTALPIFHRRSSEFFPHQTEEDRRWIVPAEMINNTLSNPHLVNHVVQMLLSDEVLAADLHFNRQGHLQRLFFTEAAPWPPQFRRPSDYSEREARHLVEAARTHISRSSSRWAISLVNILRADAENAILRLCMRPFNIRNSLGNLSIQLGVRVGFGHLSEAPSPEEEPGLRQIDRSRE